MEEILASIRRIIEDSDNARRQPDDPAPRAAVEQAAPSAKAEIETFRAELGQVSEANGERRPLAAANASAAGLRSMEPARADELQPKAFRLAEVQAQVAREAAAQPKPIEADRKPVTLADVQREAARASVATAPRPAVPTAAPLQAAMPEVPLQAAETKAPVQPKIERAAPPPVQKPAEVQRPAESQKAVELQRPAAPAAARLDAVAKPIISQAASRQVAAAFGQLSEAFAQRANKTFDEMAEQMLRPMLQEWLDNNLPVLVERLVREEIERVARGG